MKGTFTVVITAASKEVARSAPWTNRRRVDRILAGQTDQRKRKPTIDAWYVSMQQIFDSGVSVVQLTMRNPTYSRRQSLLAMLRIRAQRDGGDLETCRTHGGGKNTEVVLVRKR